MRLIRGCGNKMHNICFLTRSFRDSKEVSEENMNHIEGKGVAEALSTELSNAGWNCESVFAEDFGWAFFAAKGGQKHFITTSVDPDPDGEEEFDVEDYPPVGTLMFVNINVNLERSLWERLTGANKQQSNDGLTELVEKWIKSQSDVSKLEVHK